MKEESKKQVLEILDPIYMSSEESEVEEDDGQEVVFFRVRALPWERTKLKNLKAKLDNAYPKALPPFSKGMRKERKSGDESLREPPSGPSWAVRQQ